MAGWNVLLSLTNRLQPPAEETEISKNRVVPERVQLVVNPESTCNEIKCYAGAMIFLALLFMNLLLLFTLPCFIHVIHRETFSKRQCEFLYVNKAMGTILTGTRHSHRSTEPFPGPPSSFTLTQAHGLPGSI